MSEDLKGMDCLDIREFRRYEGIVDLGNKIDLRIKIDYNKNKRFLI